MANFKRKNSKKIYSIVSKKHYRKGSYIPKVIEIKDKTDNNISPISSNQTRMKWQEADRIKNAIETTYKYQYLSPPPSQWEGKNGTIRKIYHQFNKQFHHQTIKTVLQKNWNNEEESVCRKTREFLGDYLISEGSTDKQILADLMESGYGGVKSGLAMNIDRVQNNKKHLNISNIQSYS